MSKDKKSMGIVKREEPEAPKVESGPKVESKPKYYVKDGVTLTSKRGVLSGGSICGRSDFGSKEAFEALLEAGHIVER